MGIGGLIGNVVGTIGGVMGNVQSYNAAKKAYKRLRRMSNEAYNIAKESGDEYASYLDDLNANFDMYDIEDAFGQLEQSVIIPMERDFQENTLPQIEAAYGGGLMGTGQGQQAARAETVARAARDLSETKAGLRAEERGQAIARNLVDYDRRVDLGQTKYNIGTNLANIRMGTAGTIYQGATDRAATLAAAANQNASYAFQAGQAWDQNMGGGSASNILGSRS